MVHDSGWRSGFDPREMETLAEADQKVRDVENRRPSAGGPAADARSLRAWLPLLVAAAIGFVILLALSIPR